MMCVCVCEEDGIKTDLPASYIIDFFVMMADTNGDWWISPKGANNQEKK